MSATVTNQELGVTTTTSGQEGQTQGPTDVCYDPTKQTPVPHPNMAPTALATEHTTGKTLFQNGNVVRAQDAITPPSNPAHPDTGGGVASGTYREEARVQSGSPNVRTEGTPPARTTDPTTQNHANTTGQVVVPSSGATIGPLPDDYKKRCSYDTSTIECAGSTPVLGKAIGSHHAPTTTKKIDVLRGDTLTIKAKRKNAKEPSKAPDCIDPPHMKWRVTRSGGLNLLGSPVEPKNGDFTGDTLKLPAEWTAPMGQLDYSGNQGFAESASSQQYLSNQMNSFAQSNAAARGAPRVENQDMFLAHQQQNQRVGELRQSTDGKLNNLRTGAGLALNAAQFYNAWRAHQNPPRITITGHACSGNVSYEVHAYPAGKYAFQIPLDGLQKAGRWMSKAMSVVQTFGKLANVQVDNSLQCPGPGAAVGIEFMWKEEDDYTICREAEIALSGQLLLWTFEVKVPLTNFLAAIPALGALAAKAVGWLLQKLGVEAAIGIGVSIGCSLGMTVTFKWTKKDGWKFDNYAPLKIPIDFRLYMLARIKLSDWVHIEGQAAVVADPAFLLEKNNEGFHLYSNDFMIRVGFSGLIHIDIGLYTFHESSTWYPESWSCRVAKVKLWTIMSN